MHWLYILKCDDDVHYIGETTRLYKRFNEHIDGKGRINTSAFQPENIEAIYPLHKLINFAEYDHNITNKIYNIYFNRWRHNFINAYYNKNNVIGSHIYQRI